MIRRIISTFLVIVMLFSLVTVSVFAADEEELIAAEPEISEEIEEEKEEIPEGIEELTEELEEVTKEPLSEVEPAPEASMVQLPPVQSAESITIDVSGSASGSNIYSQAEYTAEYRDDFFTGGNGFNYALADLSFCMSWTGFYGSRIGQALMQAGFGRLYEYRYDDADSASDEAAYALAWKMLPDETPLVALAIRGGYYGGEWVSDFHVYEDSKPYVSYGFYRSAEIIVNGGGQYGGGNQSLKAYLENENIDPAKAKIWIFGYSRGAGVANCVGGILNAGGVENFDPDNLFDYTFACPCTVMKNALYACSGIYNICSEMDPVASVPPREWNFTRYGTTFALPCQSVMGAGFSDRAESANDFFAEFMSAEFGVSGMEIRMFPYQECLLTEVTNLLVSAFPTAKDYGVSLQGTLMDILYNSNMDDEVSVEFDALLSYLFRNRDFCNALTNVLTDLEGLSHGKIPDGKRLCEEIDTLNDMALHLGGVGSVPLVRLAEYVTDFAARLFISGSRIRSAKELSALTESTEYRFILYIADLIEYALNDSAEDCAMLMHHWPEVYLAWLRSGTMGDTLFEPRQVTVKPVTVGEKLAARTEETIRAVNQTVQASICVVAKSVKTAVKVQTCLTAAVVKGTVNTLKRILLPF